MKLDIIIPSHQTKDYLAKCIESIRKNSVHDHNIYVYVDGSTDGTDKWLKENEDKYKITDWKYCKENKGTSTAVNEAVKLSEPSSEKSDYLLIINDDFAFCLAPWTLIKTNKGYKEINKIKLGDSVLTHRNRFKKVTKIHKRKINEDIYEIRSSNNSRPISITKNHKIYSKLNRGCPYIQRSTSKNKCIERYLKQGKNINCKCTEIINKEPTWIKASELKKEDDLILSLNKQTKKRKIIKINFIDFVEDKFNIIKKDGYLYYGIQNRKFLNPKTNKIKESIILDKSFARLIGYYLAEGSTGTHNVEFYFHKKEKEYINDIKSIMRNKFGIDVAVYNQKNSNGVMLSFGSIILNNFFKSFGNKAHKKILIDELSNLPEYLFKELLKGYWRGDGSFDKKRERFSLTSSSLKLILSIRDYLLMLGIVPSFSNNIRKQKQIIINNKLCNVRDYYTLNISGINAYRFNELLDKPFKINKKNNYSIHSFIINNNLNAKVSKIKKVPYSGEVYNLSIEDDETYVTESFTVHNCKGWDKEFVKYLNKNTVLSLKYIEPNLTGTGVTNAPTNHVKDCGLDIEVFEEEKFEKYAKELEKDELEDGVQYGFAIHRDLFNGVGGMDEQFNPSPCHDPDFFYRLMINYPLIQWKRYLGSIVYHFSGKGLRFLKQKGESKKPNKEWQLTEQRNFRRFLNKWGEPFRWEFGGVPTMGVKHQKMGIPKKRLINPKPGNGKTSLIILSYNKFDLLKNTLESLKKSITNEKYDLIIVDDNSTEKFDYKKELEKIGFTNYHIVQHTKNEGYVTAANSGLKKAVELGNEFFCLMNNDLILSKNWLRRLTNHMEDQNIGVLSPTSNACFPFQLPNEYIDYTKADFKTVTKFADKIYKNWQGSKRAIKVKDAIMGFCFLARTEVFKKIGLIPEKTKQFYSDNFMAMELLKLGLFQYVAEDVYMHHLGQSTVNPNEDSKWKELFEKEKLIFFKSYGYLFDGPKIQGHSKDYLTLSLVMLTKNEAPRVNFILSNYGYLFDDIVIVDDNSTDETRAIALKYTDKVYIRPLNKDFGEARNFGHRMAIGDLVLCLDPDEELEWNLFKQMRNIGHLLIQDPKAKTVCFPRKNYIDGKLTEVYPDYQGRLNKKEIEWVNKVHECPITLKKLIQEKKNDSSVIFLNNLHLLHKKTSQRQNEQNAMYEEIISKDKKDPIKNIVFNSVLYTNEGITEHARQEARQLKKLGYNVLLTDTNYRDEFGKDLLEMYKPFNTNQDYFYYCNQPPSRPNNPAMSWLGNLNRKNFIGFLAFEGSRLPDDWRNIMNHNNVRLILTPSEYCKKVFQESGVMKNIEVLPHGFNPKIWKPDGDKITFDKFTFFGAGTFHLQLDRKGFDILVKAFSEEFKNDKDVQLLLKINKIYSPIRDDHQEINRHIVEGGNSNIKIIDDDLSEKEFAELLRSVDSYVMPSRAEGFGMIGLQSMACGTPLITTNKTGQMEFCNKDNCLLVETKEKMRYAPYVVPYNHPECKWYEPDINSLKQQMRKMYNDYKTLKPRLTEQALKDVKEFTWDKIGEKMDSILSKLT